jgi:serine protease AprX
MEVASVMPYGIKVVFRMRWMAGLALAVLGAMVPVALSSSNAELSLPGLDRAPAPAALQSSVTPALATLAERAPSRPVEVIVQLAQGTERAQAASAVRSLGGRVTRDLHVINAVVASMPAAGARDLAARPGVRAVSLNGAVRPQVNSDALATSFNASIQSTDVWGSTTGKGVGVAVVDTGIAGDLPDFRVSNGDRSSRVIGSAVVHPDATTATDRFGHGTHVAGIIAGDSQGRSGDDRLRGRYRGVAPDANLISIKASDDAGNSTVLDVIYGIQFAVDHKAEYNIRVLNLSLESTVAESYRTDPLDAAVESAWFKGIVVVAAAGNRGTDADAVSYAPGNDPYVISVGAVDDRGTDWTSDDRLAAWSSRGTTQDGVAKPDVFAPGSGIVSNLAPGSAFAGMCPTCVVEGQYIRAGGTSMSAPMVSGAVALALQYEPTLTPDQVKGLLMISGRPLTEGIAELSLTQAGKLLPTASRSTANRGLEPNVLVDPASGEIDYTRSSWSRSSWSSAADMLRSSWSRSSWSCDCSLTKSDAVDPARSSWSRSSWSTSWRL